MVFTAMIKYIHRLQSTDHGPGIKSLYSYSLQTTARGGRVFTTNTTANPTRMKTVDKEGVKKAVETGNPVIIDVRNPAELQGGTIPTSHNIPLPALSSALNLASEEFSQRYGFSKPASGSSLIFSCQKGVRAMSAAETAKGLGYDAICYSGSFNDWSQ
ncbi:hypothetical protein PSACC_02953 [Paramicrosporidium saccamoebae]|uniref:Rhodanese domain-containing protein n=1 Tax=Paramicrosporidium saccamoebae TaxID=1246581 RepID=A0A2H9THQ1_9FUNG|nr:hypothetical protein PSACC_02953 [Paramicrosporidium saccamoebae]